MFIGDLDKAVLSDCAGKKRGESVPLSGFLRLCDLRSISEHS